MYFEDNTKPWETTLETTLKLDSWVSYRGIFMIVFKACKIINLKEGKSAP